MSMKSTHSNLLQSTPDRWTADHTMQINRRATGKYAYINYRFQFQHSVPKTTEIYRPVDHMCQPVGCGRLSYRLQLWRRQQQRATTWNGTVWHAAAPSECDAGLWWRGVGVSASRSSSFWAREYLLSLYAHSQWVLHSCYSENEAAYRATWLWRFQLYLNDGSGVAIGVAEIGERARYIVRRSGNLTATRTDARVPQTRPADGRSRRRRAGIDGNTGYRSVAPVPSARSARDALAVHGYLTIHAICVQLNLLPHAAEVAAMRGPYRQYTTGQALDMLTEDSGFTWKYTGLHFVN